MRQKEFNLNKEKLRLKALEWYRMNRDKRLNNYRNHRLKTLSEKHEEIEKKYESLLQEAIIKARKEQVKVKKKKKQKGGKNASTI